MLNDLHRDAKLIMLSRGARAFAFSYLNVVFAIYLDKLGYSAVMIGIVFSTAYIASAVLGALWGFFSDRYGRRRILILLATLTIVSNGIYLLSSHFLFILLAVVVASVGAGGSGGGGQGGGPFNPVEHALLAEKCTPENRNRVYSMNAFVGSVMGSLGALVSGLPQYLQEAWGWGAVASYKPLFALTIVFSVGLILVYSSITEEHVTVHVKKSRMSKQAGTFVTQMSLLGIVDNLGAGMAGPLVSYWFFLRFGVELQSLGVLFSLSYLSAALSFLTAPVFARYIGIVRTMVFSHAIASFLYLIMAFAPSFWIAEILMICRSFLAYMDNPLRASFIVAMVRPEERGSAAGVTSLARVIPFGVSPAFAAYLMQNLSLSLPLLIAGGLQLVHDVAFYRLFRHVRPPEERLLR
jgi:MFS family permease